jgi:hypothetical protein
MAAYEGKQLRTTGLICGAASLATKQFHFVKLHTDGTVILPTAIADRPIGVLQNAPTVGQECEICVVGQTKVTSNEALAAGDSIGTHSDGQAAPYAVANTTVQIVGQVQAGSGAADGYAVAFVDCAGSRRIP